MKKYFLRCFNGPFVFMICLALIGAPQPVFAARAGKLSWKTKVLPALVSIQTTHPYRAGAVSQTAEDRILTLFASSKRARPTGYARDGSGIIIDPRGILVTNHHIIAGASRISVTLFNGTKMPAVLLYSIPEKDLAFVRITPPFPLDYVPLENSDKVTVGARVYTVGHALGHKGSVYEGKVSGVLGHAFPKIPKASLFQVCFGFHLFSGDSGSPLIDQKGYLVGLVAAGRRDGDQAVLAIASNQIRDAYRAMGLANLVSLARP